MSTYPNKDWRRDKEYLPEETVRSSGMKMDSCPYCSEKMPFYEIAEHVRGHESERVRVAEAIDEIHIPPNIPVKVLLQIQKELREKLGFVSDDETKVRR